MKKHTVNNYFENAQDDADSEQAVNLLVTDHLSMQHETTTAL